MANKDLQLAMRTPIANTLNEWRGCGLGRGRHQGWIPLSSWLLENGIVLFEIDNWGLWCCPPDGIRRGKEPGVYRLVEDGPVYLYDGHVQQRSALVHPARDNSGRWVMLRAVRVGTDGTHHRDILQFLSSYPVRADPRNHCVPVLRQLETEHLTISIFPMMSIGSIDLPWFFSMAEVLEFIIQTAEGLEFLHENLVVHRDISMENFVLNLSGRRQPVANGVEFYMSPFRSSFPIRYLYIDFELAVRFDPDSDPGTRLVTGPPIESYLRDSAPEVFGAVPYDPFPADVFALGLMYWQFFKRSDDPRFASLVERMLEADPANRPKAAEVLVGFHDYRESLTAQTLYGGAPAQTWDWTIPHPNAFHPDIGDEE